MEGALQGAPPLPFCLESALVDLELEMGPMRKMPQLGDCACPRPARGDQPCRRFGGTSSRS